jgi:hypothetical protein
MAVWQRWFAGQSPSTTQTRGPLHEMLHDVDVSPRVCGQSAPMVLALRQQMLPLPPTQSDGAKHHQRLGAAQLALQPPASALTQHVPALHAPHGSTTLPLKAQLTAPSVGASGVASLPASVQMPVHSPPCDEHKPGQLQGPDSVGSVVPSAHVHDFS